MRCSVTRFKMKKSGFSVVLSDGRTEDLSWSVLDSDPDGAVFCWVKQDTVRVPFEAGALRTLMKALVKKEGYEGIVGEDRFYPVRLCAASGPKKTTKKKSVTKQPKKKPLRKSR